MHLLGVSPATGVLGSICTGVAAPTIDPGVAPGIIGVAACGLSVAKASLAAVTSFVSLAITLHAASC